MLIYSQCLKQLCCIIFLGPVIFFLDVLIKCLKEQYLFKTEFCVTIGYTNIGSVNVFFFLFFKETFRILLFRRDVLNG